MQNKDNVALISTCAGIMSVLIAVIGVKAYYPHHHGGSGPRHADVAGLVSPEEPNDKAPPVASFPKGDKLSFRVAENDPLPVVVTMPPSDPKKMVRDLPDTAWSPPVRDEVVEPKPHNICEKDGGRKVTFYRHNHESWRCVYPRRRR